MSNYVSPAVNHITAPRLGLTWRREADGQPIASVHIDENQRAHITFEDPAVARELAAAIIAAAEWLEAEAAKDVTP